MRYILNGLDCPDCAVRIQRELRKIHGLEEVVVNFNSLSIELPEGFESQARAVIARIEPEVKLEKLEGSRVPSPNEKREERNKLWLIGGAGALFLVGLIFNEQLHHTWFSWAEYAILLPAYFLVGWPVITSAVKRLIRGQLFDENFLMTIATGGAIAIHQLPEAVGVMLFYAVGEYFQERAVNHSRRSIKALLNIQPEYANLLENGGSRQVKPEEVAVGQKIIVKPGEKIPLDGEIIEGTSSVDTSVLTGESVPRKVGPGERVLAVMINGHGLLTVKVTKPYQESSATRIMELVEKAGERKAPTEQFITIFSHYYTPVVVAIAALIAFAPLLILADADFSQWSYRALVLLVISCPCALMVSIPLGYFGGIGGASRNGILIKGANFLDALAKLDTVVFDKTGTLTKGVFRVTKIAPKNGFTRERLLAAAAGAEVFSNHPIAQSISNAYQELFETEVSREEIEDYREIPGHGIKAKVKGRSVLVGNDRLLHKENIIHEDCDLVGTSVYVAIDSQYAGYLLISDELKEDARETISRLKQLGVRRTIMLTGDENSVAERVSRELGIDAYYAELLPEDKVDKVEALEKQIPNPRRKLAFVGDGINDAPVITRADIGVAMGGLGRDAAIEAADVVLMEDAPSRLALGVEIARRTKSIIRQNIYLALGVKIFFIFLGTLGVAGIWEAVFADVGVTVLAVVNAGRALHSGKRLSL
jgi:Cd2+/Zn2+-exporting ATPase